MILWKTPLKSTVTLRCDVLSVKIVDFTEENLRKSQKKPYKLQISHLFGH